ECIGVKSTLDAAIRLVGRHGQVLVLGACLEPDSIVPLICIAKELTLDFSAAYNRAEFKDTIDAMVTGKVDARPMITDVIPIERVPEMFDALRKPGARAKVMVEFPH
ncbi:MAG TPA: hypothetical protein VIX59_01905, partial [Candidatus Binataceae bacterium]